MRKFLSFSLLAAILLFSSCGGGWSEDQKAQIKNKCIGNGGYDCDCYLESVVKAYPSPDDFNKLSQEEKDEVVKECAVEEEVIEEEELESF